MVLWLLRSPSSTIFLPPLALGKHGTLFCLWVLRNPKSIFDLCIILATYSGLQSGRGRADRELQFDQEERAGDCMKGLNSTTQPAATLTNRVTGYFCILPSGWHTGCLKNFCSLSFSKARSPAHSADVELNNLNT